MLQEDDAPKVKTDSSTQENHKSPENTNNTSLPEIKININVSEDSNEDSYDSKSNFDISACTESSVNTTDTKINPETTEESNEESTNEDHVGIPVVESNHLGENNNKGDLPKASTSAEVNEPKPDDKTVCDELAKPKRSKKKRWKNYIFGMFVCFVITVIGGVYCYYNKPKLS